MSGVNKVIVLGNVGNDPEIRYMPNGNAVASFSIATSEQWKDKNTGEKQERTEWHNITIFGKLAEIVEKYVKKGSKLYIEGKLKTDKYEKEGVTHYSTKIIANEMQMLDSRASGSETGNSKPAQSGKSQAAQPQANFDDFDQEIPFN